VSSVFAFPWGRVATDDHVAHVVDVNDGRSRTRSSQKSRCRALPDSRASSKDEWWSHISSIAGAAADGYVSRHTPAVSPHRMPFGCEV
jgi:hypothetical protein